MFIYNVTVNIAEDVHEEWLEWMKNKHIPDVIKTGCFVDSQILKVLYMDENTYSIQYKFSDMAEIEKYQKEFAKELQAEHSAKYKDKYAAFRTILQIIDK